MQNTYENCLIEVLNLFLFHIVWHYQLCIDNDFRAGTPTQFTYI